MAKPKWVLWMGLGLALGLLSLVLFSAVLLRSAAAQPLPIYGQVADFTLTDQEGKAVSLQDLRGQVWVADIIFTRCPGPCLTMTRQMRDLQRALVGRSQAKLVTLTTDPDFDTAPVLKAYAQRFGADPQRWTFLTGTKKQIASLATDSLKLTAIEKKPEERETPEDLFIHSTLLVLVDRQAQLRGIFETTGEGVVPSQVRTRLLDAVQRLERER